MGGVESVVDGTPSSAGADRLHDFPVLVLNLAKKVVLALRSPFPDSQRLSACGICLGPHSVQAW
jgi:hypothetical protein